MPTVASPPGSHPPVTRYGGESTLGASSPLGALLPSSGILAPAPAPAPQRALALDALRLRRGLRTGGGRPPEWAMEAFAREVELIRAHLAPVRHRRTLAASFGREAFQSLGGVGPGAALGPIRAAYAIRWLELGRGTSLPAWPDLLGTGSA